MDQRRIAGCGATRLCGSHRGTRETLAGEASCPIGPVREQTIFLEVPGAWLDSFCRNPGNALPTLGSTPRSCRCTSPSSWMAMAAGREERRRRACNKHSRSSQGVAIVRRTIEECCRLGIRPTHALPASAPGTGNSLSLKGRFPDDCSKKLPLKQRVEIMGKTSASPSSVVGKVDRRSARRDRREISRQQNNTGMTLCLAINYSSRTEIVDAMRTLSSARAERWNPTRRRGDDLERALYGLMPEPTC